MELLIEILASKGEAECQSVLDWLQLGGDRL
jgi:hypothetical protein